jgi:hypothetical protein
MSKESIPFSWINSELALTSRLQEYQDVPFSSLEALITEKNAGIDFHDPIVIHQKHNGPFVFFNDHRADAYIDRARNLAQGGQLAKVPQVNFFHDSDRILGRLQSMYIVAKRHPYTPSHAMLVPSPEDQNGVAYAKPHELSILEESHLQTAGKLAQNGWVVWLNGAFPTQTALHFHMMREYVGNDQENVFSLVGSSLSGHYDKTYMQSVVDKEADHYVPSPCFATSDPQEMLWAMMTLSKNGHLSDMCVVRGNGFPLFVLYPARLALSLKDYVIDFFPEREHADWKHIRWMWMPSAENIGFLARPSNLQIDHLNHQISITDENQVKHDMDMDWFIGHIRKKFDSLHMSEKEIRRTLRMS